jgi:uncharacterized phage protein (TIGR01671 family)
MREIKFRVWDDTFGMSHPEQYKLESKYLMQYTGLKDKNGKEIYEDDVVRLNNQFIEQVIYREGRWWTSADGQTFKVMLTDWGEVEVIGDIHQNPELIKS